MRPPLLQCSLPGGPSGGSRRKPWVSGDRCSGRRLLACRKQPPQGSPLGLREVQAAFHELAERRGGAGKAAMVEALLCRAGALEAKYLVKIITGDLRIGLRENLVEEAIASGYGRPLEDVQR